MPKILDISKQNLYELYVDLLKSGREISELLGCSKHDVYATLKYYHIEIRKNHDNPKKKHNLQNRTFGKLTVIGQDETKRKKCRLWKCRCECKKIVYVEAYNLVNYIQTTCGKCHFGNTKSFWKGYENISGTFFSNIRAKALKRNLCFDISIEYIWELYRTQNGLCKLSKLPIEFSDRTNKFIVNNASLDRIDSNKGYTNDNVQWIHKDINLIKYIKNNDEFIQICKKITNFQKYLCNNDYPYKKIDIIKTDWRWKGYKNISRTHFNSYVTQAKLNKRDFDINIEYVWRIYIKQNGLCRFSGEEIYFHPINSASIDRIDSSKGYIKNNIQIVHKDINVMKWNYTDSEFIYYSKLVAENN